MGAWGRKTAPFRKVLLVQRDLSSEVNAPGSHNHSQTPLKIASCATQSSGLAVAGENIGKSSEQPPPGGTLGALAFGFFYRYSWWDNNAGMSSLERATTEHSVGANFWPRPDVVFKLDHIFQETDADAKTDRLNAGEGTASDTQIGEAREGGVVQVRHHTPRVHLLALCEHAAWPICPSPSTALRSSGFLVQFELAALFARGSGRKLAASMA